MKYIILSLFSFFIFLSAPATAQELTGEQKTEIKKLFDEYLTGSGGQILKAVSDYQAELALKDQEEANKKAAEFSKRLKNNDSLPIAGNAEGDITVVEFFDYNCGYCRRALDELQTVLGEDKNLKVVFMDMPILGPSSQLASKWSLAAQKQDKYFEYHQALLNHSGQKDEKSLEKIAKTVGLDIKKLKKDAKSDEIAKIIDENLAEAQALNIRGTPGFVIAGQIYPGFMPADQIKEILKEKRSK